MTSQLISNFTVDQLNGGLFNILSVFNDKLLVSCMSFSQLLIYSRDGHHLSTIITNDNDSLHDAAWTPRGHIVYTTWSTNKVVVMSENGKVLAKHPQITEPQRLSISYDNVIYLADWNTGVYQSTDDGISWSSIFKSTDGWHYCHVIKVISDHSEDFWTLKQIDDYNWRLGICKRRPNNNLTLTDINFPATDGSYIDMAGSSLSYDGNRKIFLSVLNSSSVYMLSLNGQYYSRILSSNHINNVPWRLAVDMRSQFLYIGQGENVVGVFKLMTYED